MLSSQISNFWLANNDLYVSSFQYIGGMAHANSQLFMAFFRFSNFFGRKCMQYTVWNENENVNKTKSDIVIYVSTWPYQFILSVHCSWPPENNRPILRNVHITMDQWSYRYYCRRKKIDEFMKSISNRKDLITFMCGYDCTFVESPLWT